MKHLQRKVLQGQHLMYEEMLEVAQWLFQDDTPKDEIASFLTALSIKGRLLMR